MTIHDLRELIGSGDFDHATYRERGTVWEGLWIYGRDENGFRGYSVVGCIRRGDPDLDEAFELTRGTGISVGSFGNG